MKLKQIQNWAELAEQTKWSAAALARHCGVSVRSLHRHFMGNGGKSPKAWLNEDRQRRMDQMIRSGVPVKAAASSLGFKHPTNFTRFFKKRFGVCPSLHWPQPSPVQAQNVRK